MGLRQAQRDVSGLIRSRVAFDAIEDRIEEIPAWIIRSAPRCGSTPGHARAAGGNTTRRTSSWGGSESVPRRGCPGVNESIPICNRKLPTVWPALGLAWF